MRIADVIKRKIENPNGERAITIAFLGDSVTQGCFELYPQNESYNTIFNPSEAYPEKLKTLLQMVFPAVPFNIINAGISGNTTKDAFERIERDVMSYKPDLVVVCLGLNDMLKGEDQIPVFEDALSKIFAKLNDEGCETVFMTPCSMGGYLSKELSPELQKDMEWAISVQKSGLADRFVDLAVGVAKGHNIPVCDCHKKWARFSELGADTTRLLANRVNHPTPDMHWIFAWSLFEMMLELGN